MSFNMKIGRNVLCPCGSRRKYKKCCMENPIDVSDAVAKEDGRLQAITALAQPFRHPTTGEISPVGAAVYQSSGVMLGGTLYSFGVPAAPALFIDLSKQSYLQSQDIKSKTNFFNVPKPGQSFLIDNGLFFNFLEQIMASIVFAYTAIESFTNLGIPREYVHKEVRKDGRCTEEYNKDQIERFFNVEKKLELLLKWPPADGVTNPKGTELWTRLQKLQGLRDRIIHLKSVDITSALPNNPAPDTLWKELVASPETYQVAIDLIKHYSGKKPPRWVMKLDL